MPLKLTAVLKDTGMHLAPIFNAELQNLLLSVNQIRFCVYTDFALF